MNLLVGIDKVVVLSLLDGALLLSELVESVVLGVVKRGLYDVYDLQP